MTIATAAAKARLLGDTPPLRRHRFLCTGKAITGILKADSPANPDPSLAKPGNLGTVVARQAHP